MLTPGIEYFGAVDDTAAQEFVDGNARVTPWIVRADTVGPDFPMAPLGALLTGRSIEELASEPELSSLSIEHRDGTEIHLFRLPSSTSRALADADAEGLAEIGRRALVYAELAAESPDLIAAFLGELGESVRRGGGGLYARIIVPSASPRRPWLVPALRRALPWIGIGFAALSLAAALVFGAMAPVSFTPLLALAGICTSLSLGALFNRRATRRALEKGRAARGSLVVRVDANSRVLAVLPGILMEVLGNFEMTTSPKKGVFHLRADATGLAFVFDHDEIHVPADRVLGMTCGDAPGRTVTDQRLPALVVVLRIDEEHSAVCELPLLDLQGGRPTHGVIEGIAHDMARLTGSRTG